MSTAFRVSRIWGLLVAGTGLTAVACGGERPVDPTIAKAVHVESKTHRDAQEVAARLREQRQAQDAAKREQQAKRRAAAEAAAGLVSPMPSNLAAACDGYVSAYDAFMKSGNERELQEFHDGRRAELGERRAKCVKLGSIEVAACGTKVLSGHYLALADLTRHEAAHLLIESCARKFGAV